jgi:hypothetical protein
VPMNGASVICSLSLISLLVALTWFLGAAPQPEDNRELEGMDLASAFFVQQACVSFVM